MPYLACSTRSRGSVRPGEDAAASATRASDDRKTLSGRGKARCEVAPRAAFWCAGPARRVTPAAYEPGILLHSLDEPAMGGYQLILWASRPTIARRRSASITRPATRPVGRASSSSRSFLRRNGSGCFGLLSLIASRNARLYGDGSLPLA